ncbi:farnesol dehydrogenase [Zeugodacus cucurbitae]|uniref:Dehydrogenase/reductase SDR family member 11 n=1 Tax=Zeugodacus cucurbitae TaxID=28588 RepID=A0A0A1XGH0_ZEUCU|nr:farnesol dehydrogenase [Zeugodacus cucurbitae]XP_011185390.1 farnesol dehydrogenase [Zeugodacus cucurbitae]
MERWLNRIAVVTGASSGIGAAIVKYLANNGMVTVGLARRKGRVEALRDEVKDEAKARIHAIKCDVTNEPEVIATFKEIERKYGPVAVLVNNAGVVRTTDLLKEGNSQDIRNVLDTNVYGIVWCTREAFRSMKAQGDDGHVFLINSIAGHMVPFIPNFSFNIYPPSKHAVTVLTEIYRQEFINNNTKIKITSISPGGVKTEIMGPDPPLTPDMPILSAENIADALIYCLQTPPNVQIHELTIKPVGEKF